MAAKKEKDIYTLDEYLSMPYKIVMHCTGEGGNEAFFAEVLELEGCCADGATPAETYEALREEMRIHLQIYLKNGVSPPIPKPLNNKTTKVLVRMPAYLQQRLAIIAKTENISINQLIINKLSSV